jgi:uncharacterized protein involved in type VI secretion and phage assembly
MNDDISHQILTWIRSHYFGKYRGIVTDNDDTTGRGRLKVSVPSVLGDLEIWAMPCVPYAGDGVGFYSIPNKHTGVWIDFEAGDPSYPIWSGCFWADNEVPDTGGPSIKIWKTDKLSVRADDDADELVVSTDSNSTITLSDDIEIDSGGSSHTVGSSGVASSAGGTGKVEVTSASVSINSGAFEVT